MSIFCSSAWLMRFSLAFVSSWSSSRRRCCSFDNGFACNNRLRFKTFCSDIAKVAHAQSTLLTMLDTDTNECTQSKRFRKDDPSHLIGNTGFVHKKQSDGSVKKLSCGQEKYDPMSQRPPFERNMGIHISLCPKCHGEGRIGTTLSKKERARRKQIQSNHPMQEDSFVCLNKTMKNSKNEETSSQKYPSPAAPNLQLNKKPCKKCGGSGLIVIPSCRDGENDIKTNNSSETTDSKTEHPHSKTQPAISVAIVGGGIGGMALAAALQHRDIPCVVYEKDLSFEERNQGYGLTMQQGARALQSLGFFSIHPINEEDEGSNDMNKKAKTKFGIHSTRHVVHDPDGTVVGEWGLKVWGGRFEKGLRGHSTRFNAHISRQKLRKLLMEMLKPGTIQWGYKFCGYSRSTECDTPEASRDEIEQSYLNLLFKRRRKVGSNEGSAIDDCHDEFHTNATVLVGCDGIRSAVRSNKLGDDDAPLRYLGCIVILGIALSPDSSLTNGETVFQTADGTTRLYAMPFDTPGEGESIIGLREDDNVKSRDGTGLSMWQLSFPMDESDATALSRQGSHALKEEALMRCGGWHEPIPELLSNTPIHLITGYPCYDRSLVGKEILRNGINGICAGDDFVTLLGDAAHPMSPFKGQGANQALLDAVLLARKLHKVVRLSSRHFQSNDFRSQVTYSLAEYEAEMLERCAVKVKKSAEAAIFLHTPVATSKGNVTRGAAFEGGSLRG